MDKKNTSANNSPLGQVAIKLLPDLRLTVANGEAAFEIHLAPDDAIDLAVLLLKFANDIPGKHQELIHSLAEIDQQKKGSI